MAVKPLYPCEIHRDALTAKTVALELQRPGPAAKSSNLAFQVSEYREGSVRIHYDHRVMDGADVARALRMFEATLNETITEELRQAAEDLPSVKAQ